MSLAMDRLFLLPAPHWVQNPFRACAQLPLGVFLFCFVFWLHYTTCSILVPGPEIKPVPLQWKHGF